MSLKDPVIIPQAPALTNLITPFVVPIETVDQEIATTYLGTPVYSNLIFDADPDTPENRDLILNTVILEISQFRNIVTTPIAGRNGTVKEYISDGDFTITVRGSIVSQQRNVYPKSRVVALKNICRLEKEIAISGNFIDLFDITYAVVTDYSFSEKLGSRNEQPFSMNMISDTPIEIKVNA